MDNYEKAKIIWAKADRNPECKHFSKVVEIDFQELETIVREGTSRFTSLVEDLSTGTFLVIRSCFSEEEIFFLKESMLNLQKTKESTFYKMDRLIPDYWRNITPEVAKKYSVPIVKKAAYFFPWNDQKKLFALINRRWRLYKVL